MMWNPFRKSTLIYLSGPLVSAAGIALSVVLYVTFRNNELDTTVNQLENNCDVKQIEVQRQLAGGVTLLYALQSLILAVKSMTDAQWNAEVSQLVNAGNWSILSVSRSELVPLSRLDAWEMATGLRVVQTNQQLDLVPVVRDRPFYLPIINTYPSTARIRGLDNLSEHARRDVVLRGYAGRELVMSDPFYAPNANPAGGGTQRAFVLFLPLFDEHGFPTGGITEAYFENTIIRDRFRGGISYAFGIGESVLFADAAQEASAITRTRSFPVADRAVTVRCGVVFKQSPAPILIAALGIILSVLFSLASSLAIWVRRKRRNVDIEAQRLTDERQLAENLYKMRNNFLNHISHELKTPLNGIQGILTSLIDDGLTSEQKSAVLEAAKRADDLGEMLENLVEYSAFELGNAQIWREMVPVRAIVQEAVARGSALATDTVRFREPAEIPRYIVDTDKAKMIKALRILLQNAFRYTDGGEVKIQASHDPDRSTVSISVSDTGRGMSESLLAAILNGDVAYGRRTNGLGLGLSLLRKINQAVGAELNITSREGTGSTFTLTLPVAAEEPPPVEPDRMSMESLVPVADHHTKKVVLVADDNDLNRKVLCRMLRKLGYECVEADDGVAALEAYEQHGSEVGLVLMDIQMPHMDGLQATRELKGKNADIPVVAVTANAVSAELQSYMESGMSEVLSKPVNKDQLDRILKTYTAG